MKPPNTKPADTHGPVIEAAGTLHACCQTIRVALDELERVTVHLELLDHVLVNRGGRRWWERLENIKPGGGS